MRPLLATIANKALRQRMHDHRPRSRARMARKQRPEILLDPGDRAPVRLLRLLELVEDRDRGHRVVAGIDDVIGAETVDVADDRNGAVLDAARQLFRAPALCLGLTDGGIHNFLLPAIDVGFVPEPDVTPKRRARIPSLVNPALICRSDLQPPIKHASTSVP
ncbi:hypothetical protein CO683_19975 [Bradyrhizobium ottawaense]|uniref:Uncharacterized protein n=1 Tax=Bradyrhizobium ottawaense TaxID=931866 RepID=A0A2U8NZT4_9BRAD|nr:hypothetical protein CIT37_00365 [Bradyrhizobium ottawaense]PDT68034.1 hypothetical protein CO683_19975 [Bradyrhizobium ottawaense]